MELNKIIQGDCIEILRQMPSECVDVAFADPPFNLKKNYAQYSDNQPDQLYP